jgi:hypothetical protein
MSIGDIISRLLANPDTRAELRYRHEYDNRENAEPNIIADFFDGEEYKAFKRNNNFQNEHDVAIALFNDGFVTTNRGGRLFTMMHVVVLSYNPQLRYKEEYLIQLCILPGKKKPASFSSYLSVILAEMHYLSTYGMVVMTPDNQSIRSKVHCLAFGGDTLGKYKDKEIELNICFDLLFKVSLSFQEPRITLPLWVAVFVILAESILIIDLMECTFQILMLR